MNLIQSYYSRQISIEDINDFGGYNSPVINWMSMAYSCLLLRLHNPEDKLIFYGDRVIVNLFEKLFKLPYDEYNVIDKELDYSDWFYCWPKILTYESQQNPFIHIDNDIFMWDAIPSELRSAPLVAQHEERDSTFYMTVYKQLLKDGVTLPSFMKECYDNGMINSYNAGLFGGNDLSFFHQYISELRAFVNSSKDKIANSDKKFLYNVVFEQWLFWGLTHKHKKEVRTYYEQIIKDFQMGVNHVPSQVVSLKKLRYMHVMEYKHDMRVNRFIAYKMQLDFPNEYERILAICQRKGIKSGLYSKSPDYIPSQGFPDLSKRDLLILQNKSGEEHAELEKYYAASQELLIDCSKHREVLISDQKSHNLLMESIRESKHDGFTIAINPCVKAFNASPLLLHSLRKDASRFSSDSLILKIYNPIFNKIDEFIWSRRKYNFLISLLDTSDINNYLKTSINDSLQMKQIREFIRQCIFDGILILKS